MTEQPTPDARGQITTEDGTVLTVSDRVVDSRGLAQFGAAVEGEPAGIIDYAVTPPDSAGPDPRRTIVFLHTETFPAHGGHGIAAALTRWALEQVRSQRGAGMLVPQCPYTRQFVLDHPEFADLVAAGPWRR